MSKLITLIKAEPAAFFAVVQSGLALIMAFGLKLTADQIGAILSFTSVVLGFATRSMVTPNVAPAVAPAPPAP